IYSFQLDDGNPDMPVDQAPVDQAEFDKTCLVQGDVLVFASKGALYKYRNNVQPGIVPNLEQAFTLAGNAPAQVIFAPTDVARQELSEFGLPPQLGIDGTTLLQGIQYGAVSLSPPPGFAFKVETQGRDPGAAQQVHNALTNMFQQFRQMPNLPPEMGEIIDGLMPKLENDRLVMSLREGDPVYQKL